MKKEDICAVVVTYHPDPGFELRLAGLTEQVGSVAIVDNHSDEAEISMLREVSRRSGIHLILNEENMGIASALNKGVGWAKENGYQWALTMDQDSTPLEGMVESLIKVHRDCPFREGIGVIGSNYRDPNTGEVFRESDSPWRKEKTVITSGSLLSLSAFEKVGPFREDFFIDQVDHEYCLRLRKNGYDVLLSLNIGMAHPVGLMKVHRLLWKRYEVTNHNPLRRYYIMRNSTVLAQEYRNRWMFRVLKRFRKEIFKVLMYEDHKALKIYAMILGISDALRGRMGRLGSHGVIKSRISIGH